MFLNGGLLMAAGIGRYTGKNVEIIYIDSRGRISQRTIAVLGIRGDAVRAFCIRKRAFRLFKLERILAVSPFEGRRSG